MIPQSTMRMDQRFLEAWMKRGRYGILAAALTLLVSACALPVNPEDPPPEEFRAVGNEPGWRVDLGREKLELTADYGATRLSMPPPDPRADHGGWRFSGQRDGVSVALWVRESLCRDSMTGMPYPMEAELVLDGTPLPGCAGEPASLLLGNSWGVVEIDGSKPLEGSTATIVFSESGHIGGRSSCNSYMGSYALSGEGLTVSGLASTRMACAPEVMAQESRFLELLQDVVRFDFDEAGVLILHAGQGHSIQATRR